MAGDQSRCVRFRPLRTKDQLTVISSLPYRRAPTWAADTPPFDGVLHNGGASAHRVSGAIVIASRGVALTPRKLLYLTCEARNDHVRSQEAVISITASASRRDCHPHDDVIADPHKWLDGIVFHDQAVVSYRKVRQERASGADEAGERVA